MSDALSATGSTPVPDDVAALQALLGIERARAERLSDQNERLRAILRELQRALFGRRSEKSVHADQLELALPAAVCGPPALRASDHPPAGG